MKSLLVIDDTTIKEELETRLSPLGFDFIHYTNPLKALENLEEISPDVVFFSAQDFPRHWKPFLMVIDQLFPRDKVYFFLLTGDGELSFDEAAKASHLKVSGIVGDFSKPAEFDNLLKALNRRTLLFEQRLTLRYTPQAFDEIYFMFTHPRSLKLITGKILDFSQGGLSFFPDNPYLTADLLPEEKIALATLSIEENPLYVHLAIVRNNENMALRYDNLPEGNKSRIVDYIQHSLSRALQAKIHG
jgi:ActR/RegA family two-component response regulator